MPCVAYACPETAPTYGEVHSPEYCITKCKNRCLSPFLIAALTASNRKNHHKGRYISATSLAGCTRKLKLERTVDYAEEFKNLLYAFRGTVTHVVLEEAADLRLFEDGKSLLDLGFLSEWTMMIGFCFRHGGYGLPDDINPKDQSTWRDVPCPWCDEEDANETILLGGTLDGLEPLWELFDPKEGVLPCVLHDLKTMQEYAVQYFICGDPKATLHTHIKDDYVRQANVYRYLAERSVPPPELRERGVRQLRLVESRIQAFAMGHFPYTGAKYRYRKHYKHEWAHWDIPTIEFFEDKWAEEYIRENGRPIYESLILDQTRGPICEPDANSYDMHSWRCNFCVFYGSEYCPSPETEWKALQEGADPEEAFAKALETLQEEEAV